jgi:hypothetical protein
MTAMCGQPSKLVILIANAADEKARRPGLTMTTWSRMTAEAAKALSGAVVSRITGTR